MVNARVRITGNQSAPDDHVLCCVLYIYIYICYVMCSFSPHSQVKRKALLIENLPVYNFFPGGYTRDD